jgi:RNA polymerase sigma-70 factor (ECF subfamily)
LCAGLVDPESADDLAQETFVRALRSLGSFRGDSSARTWLWAIARNTCTDAIRRRVRHRAAFERLPRPVVESIDDEPAAAYAGVLDELDADQRTAFVLTQLLDLSYAEAATVCDCPVGTIRSRVARARATLLQAIEAGEAGEAGESLGFASDAPSA